MMGVAPGEYRVTLVTPNYLRRSIAALILMIEGNDRHPPREEVASPLFEKRQEVQVALKLLRLAEVVRDQTLVNLHPQVRSHGNELDIMAITDQLYHLVLSQSVKLLGVSNAAVEEAEHQHFAEAETEYPTETPSPDDDSGDQEE